MALTRAIISSMDSAAARGACLKAAKGSALPWKRGSKMASTSTCHHMPLASAWSKLALSTCSSVSCALYLAEARGASLKAAKGSASPAKRGLKIVSMSTCHNMPPASLTSPLHLSTPCLHLRFVGSPCLPGLFTFINRNLHFTLRGSIDTRGTNARTWAAEAGHVTAARRLRTYLICAANQHRSTRVRKQQHERGKATYICEVWDDGISSLGVEVLVFGGLRVGDDALHAWCYILNTQATAHKQTCSLRVLPCPRDLLQMVPREQIHHPTTLLTHEQIQRIDTTRIGTP